MTSARVSTDSPVSHLRLLAVVGPPVVQPESMVHACVAAEAGGITAVQVRWKGASGSQLAGLTEDLVRELSIPVYVNDRADVAWAAGAAGVHLGAADLDPGRVRAVSPRGFLIGVSVGTEAEAQRASTAQVDYWSIGAIYHTGTKPDAGAPIGISGFSKLAVVAPVGMPVIAIGGIGCANVAGLIRAGAIGVAVANAVFGSPEIETNARSLRAIIDEELSAASG